MPINWDKFQTDIDGLVDDAGERTDAKLASRISSVTRLTDDEVKKLFPDPADVKKLAELMEISRRQAIETTRSTRSSQTLRSSAG